MRRTLLLPILLAASATGSSALAQAPAPAEDMRLRGTFTPLRAPDGDVRPAVGEVRLNLEADGDARVDLVVSGLTERVTSATLHTGEAGENGEQVARMDVTLDGSEGRIIGATTSLSPLIAERVRAGGAYVVVRTSEHPDGILRAQLAPQARSLEAVVAGD